MASSEVRMMVGRIIAARVSPPERMDQPIPSVMTKNTKPKSPKMMLGTPASDSVPNRMNRVSRPSRVYSVR